MKKAEVSYLRIVLIIIIVIFTFYSTCKYFYCYDYVIKSKANMPPDFKVAFIGDQGLSNYSRAVLKMIKDEKTDMVLHLGDFDYQSDPDKWENQINDVLGEDFPYFAVIGNHDVGKWTSYQRKLKSRLNRIKGVECKGELGIKSACTYKGLFFILSGAGTKSLNHEIYIRNQLKYATSTWRICSWHKNQRLMQVGDKKDEVGWGPYEECRKAGAIIATAHEHSYSRTYLMSNFKNQSVASTSNILKIEKNKTFAFVSALGGRSIRGQNDTLASNKWWASVYTSKQDANYGALFCIFNVKGIRNRAYCYFKDIDGRIADEFDIINELV